MRRSKTIVIGLIVLGFVVCTEGLAAGVGQLQPVAYRSDAIVDGGALFDCPNDRFAAAPAGCGTVSPRAVVATPAYRDFRFHVAVDARDAAGESLDCVRFDFSGRGQFANAPVVPMRAIGPDHYAFGPAEVTITHAGRTIPAQVRGEYTHRGETRWIGVKIGTGLQGLCQFGDNARWLVILDGTGNLDCADPMNARLIDGRLVIRPEDEAGVLRVSNGTLTGDTILVDVAPPGSAGRRLVEQLYGQPVWVDGKWYRITVSPDRTRVSATAVDLPTGRLKTDHNSWSTRLVGENGTFVAIGIAEPDGPAIPAGRYAVMGFHQYIRGEGVSGSITCRNRDVTDGRPYIIEVRPGQTTLLKVGSPLTANLTARQAGGTITFQVMFTDADGGTVDALQTNRSDGLAAAPDLEIHDAAGRSLFVGKLSFSGQLIYSLSWPVPAGVKGELTATLKNVVGPCSIATTPLRFTIAPTVNE